MIGQTREDVFKEDRGETYYECGECDEIELPVTRLGFELLVAEVALRTDLPNDDVSKQVLAGYIHHLANDVDTTTLKKLMQVLWKSVSNFTSWTVDQEIKEKRREAEREAMKQAGSTLSMVGANGQTLPSA